MVKTQPRKFFQTKWYALLELMLSPQVIAGGKQMIWKASALLCGLVTSGCVSITIPDDLPEHATINVEVYMSGYKSAAGRDNLLEVKTDAEATLPLLRQKVGGTYSPED